MGVDEFQEHPALPLVLNSCRFVLPLFLEIAPGDTLYQIAKEQGVTVEGILALNPGINPHNLKVGAFICLPILGTAARRFSFCGRVSFSGPEYFFKNSIAEGKRRCYNVYHVDKCSYGMDEG